MRDDTNRRGFDSHYIQLAAPALIGFLVGSVGWMVNRLVQMWIIVPLFCQSPDSFSVCNSGGTVAWTITTLVLVGLSVIAMVRFYVFRPLLVAIAVLLAVWGIGDWLAGLPVLGATVWQALIFGFAYAIFAWVARVNMFWMAAAISIVLVIVCRVAIGLA